MEYLATDRGKHQPLIRRQVELDLRPAARSRGDRAAICDLALTVRTAARIFVDIEFELIGGDVQSRLFRYPTDDFFEHRPQEILVKMTFIAEREIQVLRKPIGLEVTFLQTGASLEDPAFRELFMRVDAGEYPAQDVVLLDNIGQRAKTTKRLRGFRVCRSWLLLSRSAGTQSRQAVMSFLERRAGSSRGIAMRQRERHSAASFLSREPSICKKSEPLEDGAVVELLCIADQQIAISCLTAEIRPQAISHVIDSAADLRRGDHVDQGARGVRYCDLDRATPQSFQSEEAFGL